MEAAYRVWVVFFGALWGRIACEIGRKKGGTTTAGIGWPICVTITVLIVSCLACGALASTDAKSPRAKPTAAKATTAIASSDASPGSYDIQVITSEDDFAQICWSPQTRVTNGKRPASVTCMKRGMKLTCRGNWVNDKPRWFKADSIEIRGAISNAEVMSRVEAACQKITRAGASTSQSSASYIGRRAQPPSCTGTRPVTSSTAQPRKQEEAKEPQLGITDIDVRGNPNGGFCMVSVVVSNLADRTITGLAAAVDFFSDDGQYVCSSKYHYGVSGDLPVTPGARYVIQIETSSYGDEWPSISGCKFRFTSRNLGNLTLSSEDQGMTWLSR